MGIRTTGIMLAAIAAVALIAGASAGEAEEPATAAAPGSGMAPATAEVPAEAPGEPMGEPHEEGEILPETLHFLQPGWWVLHIIAIIVVWLIGFTMGKKKAAAPAGGQPSQT
ncbi:MAG: hypothetical protein ACODAJ_01070 [Planctomycetota bacterium]